jgi:hypothetical protein
MEAHKSGETVSLTQVTYMQCLNTVNNNNNNKDYEKR